MDHPALIPITPDNVRTAKFRSHIDEALAKITFRGELITKHLRDRQWQVMQAFDVLSDGVLWFTVPAGMVTDFVTIPRPFWALLDPEDPELLFASVAHDFLYDQRCPVDVTRREADLMLREGARSCGATWLERQTVYWAVRALGRKFWRCGESGIPR